MRAPTTTPLLILISACGPGPQLDRGPIPALGGGLHQVTHLMEQVGDRSDGLKQPYDLAFNPEIDGELWVVNNKNDSVSIFEQAGTPSQTSKNIVDPYAEHFMDQVSSIDFGTPGTLGTCQDSRNDYNGTYPPDFFMGPTLWSSDPTIFGKSNPEAVQVLSDMWGMHVDLGSHLDMLHESPNCMGITWERRNIYWVFDGFNSSIARYDFHNDHGMGWDDHSDGEIQKWLVGEVERVPGVPSHLVLDPVSSLLYVADTGNNRILAIDTTSGKQGTELPVWEPGTRHHEWKNEDWTVLIDGKDFGMVHPAGIALVDGVLLVTDNETSVIHAFNLDGQRIDFAPTGLEAGSLAGIIARNLDDIWFADKQGNAIYRLTP